VLIGVKTPKAEPFSSAKNKDKNKKK